MPSKGTKKRRQERVKQAQQEQRIQVQSAARSQQETSEHGLSASFESLPSSSTASQQKEEIEGLERLTISREETKRTSLVPKPPPSRIGKPIHLLANHFSLKIPNINVYHYDVEIMKLSAWKEDPASAVPSAEATGEDVDTVKERGDAKKGKYRCFNTKTNRKILGEIFSCEECLRGKNYVYDGKKNLYAVREIPDISLDEFPFQDDFDRECMFSIVIKPVVKPESNRNTINLQPLNELFQRRSRDIPNDCVMVLETIMRHQPAAIHIPIGISFYPDSGFRKATELSGGKLVVKGYHQSILLTERNAVLNIDVAATTFYQPGSVIEFLDQLMRVMVKEKYFRFTDLYNLPDLTELQRKRLDKELNGCRIYAIHFDPHRKYKVHGVSEKSANELLFENEDKRMMSVTEYFREKYNIRLEYGRFPCLKINRNREIYLPLEVCRIPEKEHCLGKPSKLQTAEMIKSTALPPQQRFTEIQRTVDLTKQRFGPQHELFGITVDGKPVKVIGRVLDPPKLQYKNSVESPNNGQWNLVNNKLLNSVIVRKWIIISASATPDMQRSVTMFSDKLLETAKKFGLTMHRVDEIIYARSQHESAISDLLKKICKQKDKIELVVVVLKSKNDNQYCKIKCTAETELGIITQCVAEQNIKFKCNEQFLANLCLKINGKLGGQNSTIEQGTLPDILDESTMIIGADCNHPGKYDPVQYSVAATVCNLDPEMVQFAAAYTIQLREKNKPIDLIKKLECMVIELLKTYHRSRKRYPKRIIFFRDGVSEGEYLKTLHEEVPQIQKACGKLIRDECKLTFLVVNKRHHTRLLVENPRDGVKPQGNIPPGTKVDTDITHVLNFDFFLCSHNGIKGTSRPAHYTVIYDDNNFSSEENKPKLEKLCYFLCHVSSRCTRSISIPAPVCYADLAAYRAKQYLIASSSNPELISSWARGIHVATQITDRMYFI